MNNEFDFLSNISYFFKNKLIGITMKDNTRLVSYKLKIKNNNEKLDLIG